MQNWPYRIRHHWIVLLDPPGRWTWLLFALLVVVAITGGWWGLIPLVVVVTVFFLFRYQEWRAEVIELDPRAVRHARGVKETTTSNAFLRIDRVSGVVMSRTVPGKLLGYGTVHLEAPGDHPDFKHLVKIQKPLETFTLIEALMFKTSLSPTGASILPAAASSDRGPYDHDGSSGDPDDTGADIRATEPLPSVDQPRTDRPRTDRPRTDRPGDQPPGARRRDR
jgi:hypothetical protein